jgi:hypothetical protein
MRQGYLALAFALVAVTARSAHAGAALDDDASKPTTGAPAAAPEEPAPPEAPLEYGVGIRIRDVFLPQSAIGLLVNHVPGGVSNGGLGIDLTRRRGTTELQLGLEYEHLNAPEGVWINRGDTVPGAEADYLLSPEHSGNQFGWLTIEFTFFNHKPINDWLSFRYGAGLGLGILTGEVDHYNIRCAAGATNANPEPGCVPPRFNGGGTYTDPQPGQEVQVAYGTPPVFPVLNLIVGLQFKPSDKMTVNIEGGIRTLPFFGVDASYFF